MSRNSNNVDPTKRIENLTNRLKGIDIESKGLKGKIISAMKKQRIYDIEGEDSVFFDIVTGLLWFVYDYESKYTINAAIEEISGLDVGFQGFRLPKIKEFQSLLDSGILDQFKSSDCFLTEKEVRTLKHLKGMSAFTSRQENKGYILACSDTLFEKVYFDAKIYSETFKHNPAEGYKLAYTLMIKNKIVFNFYDAGVNKLCKAYYIDKPRLQKELSELKKADNDRFVIEKLDYKDMISAYDVSEINTSLYEYCVNVEKLCNSINGKIEAFEEKNSDLIKEIRSKEEIFSNEYIRNDKLTDEENYLFEKGYETIKKIYDHRLDIIKVTLKKNAADIRSLKKELDKASYREDMISYLGSIEAEPRASFALLFHVIVDAVNRSYYKIESFVNKQDCFIYISDTYIERYKYYLDFVSEGYIKFIQKCEIDDIDKEIAEKWFAELRDNMFIHLNSLIEIIDYYIGVKSGTEDKNHYKELCDLLLMHHDIISDFFNNKRKDIYKKYAFKTYGDILEKLETERSIYENTSDFRKKVYDLIFKSAKNEAALIVKCTEKICDKPLDQLSDLKDFDEMKKISIETFDKLEKIKKRNFMVMEKDAKYYAEEQEKRDSEFTSLLFKMQKELIKG